MVLLILIFLGAVPTIMSYRQRTKQHYAEHQTQDSSEGVTHKRPPGFKNCAVIMEGSQGDERDCRVGQFHCGADLRSMIPIPRPNCHANCFVLITDLRMGY